MVRSNVLEGGGCELPIEGQPTRLLKVGEAFQIPPETPHAGGKPGYENQVIDQLYRGEGQAAREAGLIS